MFINVFVFPAFSKGAASYQRGFVAYVGQEFALGPRGYERLFPDAGEFGLRALEATDT